MEIINGFDKLPSLKKKTAVTIGNFDGVHLGHQRILKFVVNEAEQYNLISLVLTFSPHPDKILGDGTLKLIQTLDQRLESIESLGIKYAVIVPFNQNFATLSSLEFVQKILKETLKVESAVVGENFRFGKDREGDISQLIRFGKRFGFRVHEISSVEKNGRRVSSSLIRSMLEAGSIEEANQFLGRNYEIRGKVVKGMSRGKALGFPTANIKSENEIVPPGVFISEAIIDNKKYLSMTNVGHRPTFGPEELHVESYLLNLKNDIYGKKISLSFIKKMREERKFTSVDQLATQLRKDLKMTKSYFKLQRR